MFAIKPDGHSLRDSRYVPYGADQARREGLANLPS
jgi:hypothetical protein